ncbi:DNA cytosine methyltransferase [Ferroplasma acidiphilum]|uniref:DNA (cytosine-5-)-methyltransferase n=1 Tax=Ferroplasma acidiphilum TaxID=74969 RepID=A0A7K4FQD7_9ARCH|nr:DNA cytosine methyltransferase [Ferroplasma acidiphilum]NOL60518.1 DNA cytosine methyltransferase [Ferroplasma acidiphilum]
MVDTQDLLTVSDVAKRLKVTVQSVRLLIRDGKLRAERVGSQWLTSQVDLQDYIGSFNVVIEPDDHERLSSDVPPIAALSFFSGAMGLDIGMGNAGIKALLACEYDKACRMTIEKNNPDIALIGDIAKYSAEEMLKMAKIPPGRKVDVIFGGPPCQAFSTAGRRKAFDDERGNVFLRFLGIISDIKPTYVVIENVRGLLSTPFPYKGSAGPIKGGALMEILDRLRAMGYSVSFNLYNAAYFGAPQARERVVIIGKLGNEKVSYLQPTHNENGAGGLKPWRTLKDALDELPQGIEHHYIEFPEARLKYYRMLNEGQCWKNLPQDMQKEAMGKSYYLGGGKTGFLRRLSFSKPSPTLVTNPTMPATDLAHPVEDRPLSVEEYAHIQGFPPGWEVCGSLLDQYRQIGNAVPIKLGEAIGRAIIDDMDGIKHEYRGFKYSRYKDTDEVSWAKLMKKQIRKASTEAKLEDVL